MNNETKKLLKDKIAKLEVEITAAQKIEDNAKAVYDTAKANRQALQLEKQKIKEDLPA